MWTPKTSTKLPDFDDLNLTFEDLIQAAKDDIVLADELWLPNSKRLKPFQRINLRAMHECNRVWLQSIRGSAKSYIDARAALLLGLMHPIKIVCTGPTFRQALHPFNYIDTLIRENSDDELPLSLAREQEGPTVRGNREATIKLKNGTIIKALPMGDGERIRGERADILICDEFFLMEREMFKMHLLPFLMSPMEPGDIRKIFMSTSAEYEDSYAYALLTKTIIPKVLEEDAKAAADPNFRRTTAILDWDIDDLRAEGYNIPEDVLDLLLDGANQDERDQALYNKWKGTSGQFLPPNLIDRMSSPRVVVEYMADGLHEYVMTVDVARAPDGDDFIVHIFKAMPEWGNKLVFVHSYRNKGLSAAEMAWKIFEYDARFDVTWVLMDKGGGGLFVRDELMKTTLEFPDGTKKEIKPRDFILEHNENRSIPGRKKLLFNRYSDELVRSAFADDRSRGGEYIQNEDILSHLLYDGLRQSLLVQDIPFLIPGSESSDGGDGDIFDLIHTSIQQLKLLRLETKVDAEGNKIVVKSKTNNVPKYNWKHADKDGGVAFCYAYILYKLMFRGEIGRYDYPELVVVPAVPDITNQFDGMQDFNPGQYYSPFQRGG